MRPPEVEASFRRTQENIQLWREGKLVAGPKRNAALTDWRADASDLRDAGFPLASTYNFRAAQWDADGRELLPPAEILARFEHCRHCPEFDGRKCSLCRGCSGTGEKAYLLAIATPTGHCLRPDPAARLF